MSSHRKIILLILVLVTNFMCTCFSEDSMPNENYELENLFKINKGLKDVGGCDESQIKWLKRAFTDTMLMMRGASADIAEVLRQPAVNEVDSSRGRFGRLRDWLFDLSKKYRLRKTARLLDDLFGFPIHDNGSVYDEDDKHQIEKIRRES